MADPAPDLDRVPVHDNLERIPRFLPLAGNCDTLHQFVGAGAAHRSYSAIPYPAEGDSVTRAGRTGSGVNDLLAKFRTRARLRDDASGDAGGHDEEEPVHGRADGQDPAR